MSEQWDGRPENPEQDGWHWLRTGDSLVTCEWSAARGWRDETWIVRAWELPYAGPCLTPAEVEAEKAATRREGIEAAAKEVDCGCDIRDAVLARLEAQGQKRASWLCQHGDVCCALQAAEIRTLIWEGGR